MEARKKVGDRISQEMMVSAAGLEKIWNDGSTDFLLDHLESVSLLIDKIVDSDDFSEEDEMKIIDMCYWQRNIITELRQTLNTHYHMILGLTRKFDVIETEDKETFTANSRKLDSLRGLLDLFHHDKLHYSRETEMVKLRCWALAYGYDLDRVISLLDADKESCLQKVA